MGMPVAFITGITGQDGAYLAAFLLEKGYVVHGAIRRNSLPTLYRLERLNLLSHQGKALHLHYADMTDALSLVRLLSRIHPDEVYNLAAQSDVGVSFELPEYTTDTNALGTIRLLEAMRGLGMSATRYFQASTSEIFGNCEIHPQDEQTPFMPCSPYGVAKLSAYWTTVNYRNAYGFHASNGIMFNHESPLRGLTFVTRKVTEAVAAIYTGQLDCLTIGNLEAQRDWGHTTDYVKGMWQIIRHDIPGDYVLATGIMHTVRKFITHAFACVNIHLTWQGTGIDEVGLDPKSGIVRVRVDPKFFRPKEVNQLCGNASKAKRDLGWQPRITFEMLVQEMVEADIALLQK